MFVDVYAVFFSRTCCEISPVSSLQAEGPEFNPQRKHICLLLFGAREVQCNFFEQLFLMLLLINIRS